MKHDRLAISYHVYSEWGPRLETPEEIAVRLRLFVDRLVETSPCFAKWRIATKRRARFYEAIRDDLAPVIRGLINVDDEGPCAIEGYSLGGYVREQPSDKTIHFGGNAGAVAAYDHWNGIDVETSWGQWPDPAIIEYPVFKAILTATVDSWDPFTCGARTSDLIDHYEQRGPFHEAWMLYVPPHLAKTVQPPDIPVVESMPNGGLFLAATTETFKTDNPVHLEAARRIGRATRHLNVGKGAEKSLPKQVVMYRDPETGEVRPLYP
ncbi:MAG: Imm52 family immunity protein [Beijerinckiaceae bacterium]|jgi:hypothetical protein